MSPRKLFRMISGITRLGASMEALMGKNIRSEDIAEGASGSFDARSLSCYLAIARLADIEYVPAMPLVTVSARRIDRLVSHSGDPLQQDPLDLDEIERMQEAMEALPVGWMVRHDHVGDDSLKAAAAMGMPPKDGLEQIGWALHNNRAIPRFWDQRILKAMAQSLVDEQTFYARPWIDAKRRRGDDPHRHGTSFAGEGSWPREWRAFIMDGQVLTETDIC